MNLFSASYTCATPKNPIMKRMKSLDNDNEVNSMKHQSRQQQPTNEVTNSKLRGWWATRLQSESTPVLLSPSSESQPFLVTMHCDHSCLPLLSLHLIAQHQPRNSTTISKHATVPVQLFGNLHSHGLSSQKSVIKSWQHASQNSRLISIADVLVPCSDADRRFHLTGPDTERSCRVHSWKKDHCGQLGPLSHTFALNISIQISNSYTKVPLASETSKSWPHQHSLTMKGLLSRKVLITVL